MALTGRMAQKTQEAPINNEPKKESLLKKSGNFLGELGKGIAKSLIGTAARTASQMNPTLSKIFVPETIAGIDTRYSKDPKKALGQATEDALNLVTAGEGAALETTGKEVTKKVIAKTIAKTALKDAVIGGIAGASTELQNKDATPLSIAKSAGTNALVGTLLPPILGTAFKGGASTLGMVGRMAGKSLEKTATNLEAKAIQNIPTEAKQRFYESVEKPVATVGQKIAGGIAKGIRGIQKLPLRFNRQFLDRYSGIESFQNKAKEAGIDAPDLHELVQATPYRATGVAENKLDDYLKLRSEHGNDWQYVKEYAQYLDDLDRLANGNKIAGGRTVEQVKSDMGNLLNSLSPAQKDIVQSGQEKLQGFLNKNLQDAVASGRLSQESYDAIKKAHPNYTPHDVLDYIDETSSGQGKSFNMAKSGIEKAEGSTREIDDIDNAVVNRIQKQTLLDEKNKAMNAIIDTGKNFSDSGFVPLRTKENVEKRIDYASRLQATRDAIQKYKQQISEFGGASKEKTKQLDTLNAELEKLNQSYFDELARYQGESGDVSKLYQQEIERRDQAKIAQTSLGFFDEKLNEGYQEFKKLAKLRPWMLDEATDDKVLKGRLKIENLDDRLFKNGEGKNDDILAQYKKEFIRERGVNKNATGVDNSFIRSTEKQQKVLNSAEEKVINLENEIKGTAQDKANIESGGKTLIEEIKKLSQERSGLFEDIKNVRDINLKKIDVPKGFTKVSYYNNGVKEDWLIPEDIGGALKNMDGETSGAVLNWINNTFVGKVATAPARVIRKLATGINPVFAAFSNPVRDIQTVGITTKTGSLDILKGLIKTITGGKEDEDLLRLARSSGALQGSIFREGLKPEDILKQKLPKDLQPKKNAAQNIGSVLASPFNAIEKVGQKMEEMTRFTVFKSALKQGSTPEQAAKLARNSTVDFGKSGSTIQVLNKFIPFLNARIQGFSNMTKAIKNDPERATRLLLWTAAYPAVFLNAYNNKYESYQLIPDNEKRKYWIIMTGENMGKDLDGKKTLIPNYVKIPKGEAQQPISNGVERILNRGKEKYPDTTGQFISKIIGDTSPVTESSLLPAGIQQAVELSTNHSFFKNKPIEPNYIQVGKKSLKTEEVPSEYHSTQFTSEIAKALGKATGWSPIKIDYLIKQGVLNDAVRSFDLKKKGFQSKEGSTFQKATELPFIRTVIGSSYYGQDEQKRAFEKTKVIEKNRKKIERKINPL